MTNNEDGPGRIKQLLAEQERDSAWLARKVGRSKSYVWRVLNGERPLTPPLAASCAEVLGVDVRELLSDGGGA